MKSFCDDKRKYLDRDWRLIFEANESCWIFAAYSLKVKHNTFEKYFFIDIYMIITEIITIKRRNQRITIISDVCLTLKWLLTLLSVLKQTIFVLFQRNIGFCFKSLKGDCTYLHSFIRVHNELFSSFYLLRGKYFMDPISFGWIVEPKSDSLNFFVREIFDDFLILNLA